MTNYRALQTEIALSAYAALTDAQIVAAINAATVTTPVDVSGSHIQNLLLTTGEWGAIVMASRSGSTVTAALQAVAINLVDTCKNSSFYASIPAVLTEVQTNLAALVAGGLLTASTQTLLLATTTATTSRAVQCGFANGVSESDLIAARAA